MIKVVAISITTAILLELINERPFKTEVHIVIPQ